MVARVLRWFLGVSALLMLFWSSIFVFRILGRVDWGFACSARLLHNVQVLEVGVPLAICCVTYAPNADCRLVFEHQFVFGRTADLVKLGVGILTCGLE